MRQAGRARCVSSHGAGVPGDSKVAVLGRGGQLEGDLQRVKALQQLRIRVARVQHLCAFAALSLVCQCCMYG